MKRRKRKGPPDAPPWPRAQERDFKVALLGLVREWRNAFTPRIRALLQLQLGDDGMDSLFEDLETSWVRLVAGFAGQARQTFARVDVRHSSWWQDFTSRATGVAVEALQPLMREPWLVPELDARTAQAVRRIRGIGETAAANIEDTIRAGVRSGRSTRAIAEEVGEAFDMTERRAMTIARNEIGNYVSTASELRQKDAGGEQYIWSTVRDERVRDAHAEREGETFSWDAPPKGGHPGQAINCRCVARFKLPETLYGIPVNPQYRTRQDKAA